METEPAAPTAVIFPFCITSTPFSITPCVIVRSLPPRNTMVLLLVGAGRALELFAVWAGDAAVSASRREIFLNMTIGSPYSDSDPCPAVNGQSKHRHQSRLRLPGPWRKADNCSRW